MSKKKPRFLTPGATGLTICGIILLHLPLPIPGFLLERLGSFTISVDPVQAPIWSVAFLTIGIILLLRRRKTPTLK
jgi:hypothetical protein